MSKENGRYMHSDVKGHTFVSRKPYNPPEVRALEVAYGTVEYTVGDLSGDPWKRTYRNLFVTFEYEWQGETYQASLQWHKFLTIYKRKDW